MVRTYSFENTIVTISHPDVGQYTMYGAGLGDIMISRSNDETSHEISADLSVLISKSVKKNGTITINVLQASDANDFMIRLVKYVETAVPAVFAQTQISIESNSTGEKWVCTGVSPQKMADVTYGAQGTTKPWNMMAASIELQ